DLVAHLDRQRNDIVDRAAEHRDTVPSCQPDWGVEETGVLGDHQPGGPPVPDHPDAGVDQPAALPGGQVEHHQVVGTDPVEVGPTTHQTQSGDHRVTGQVADL